MGSKPLSTSWIPPGIFPKPPTPSSSHHSLDPDSWLDPAVTSVVDHLNIANQQDLAANAPDSIFHHPPSFEGSWIDSLLPHHAISHTRRRPVTDPGVLPIAVSQAGVSSPPTTLIFQCLQYPCQSSFDTREDLERHSRTHQMGRPYTCQFCNKTFSTSHVFRVHLKRHGRVTTLAEGPVTCHRSGNTNRALRTPDDRRSRFTPSSTPGNSGVGPIGDTQSESHIITNISVPTESAVTDTTHVDRPSPNCDSPGFSSPGRSSTMLLLSNVLKTSEKRRALLKFIDHDAQVIVDFLQSVRFAKILYPDAWRKH